MWVPGELCNEVWTRQGSDPCGDGKSGLAGGGSKNVLPGCKGQSSCRECKTLLMSLLLERKPGNQLFLVSRREDGALETLRPSPLFSP